MYLIPQYKTEDGKIHGTSSQAINHCYYKSECYLQELFNVAGIKNQEGIVKRLVVHLSENKKDVNYIKNSILMLEDAEKIEKISEQLEEIL